MNDQFPTEPIPYAEVTDKLLAEADEIECSFNGLQKGVVKVSRDNTDSERKRLVVIASSSTEQELLHIRASASVPFTGWGRPTSDCLIDANERLQSENAELRAKLSARGETAERIPELERFLQNVFVRVHPASKGVLEREGTELRNTFLKLYKDKYLSQYVVVLSIDIRRSTELMLQAKDNLRFSDFMTSLCSRMQDVITNNFGIYDKFTGDGLLAFFPRFFSGDHALRFAVNAAIHCKLVFDDTYNAYEHIFHAVIADIGVGIGIDAGNATIVNIPEGITVVGNPVVFACRLNDSMRIDVNRSTGLQIEKRLDHHTYNVFRSDTEVNEWEGIELVKIPERQIKGLLIRAYTIPRIPLLSTKQFEAIVPKWFQGEVDVDTQKYYALTCLQRRYPIPFSSIDPQLE